MEGKENYPYVQCNGTPECKRCELNLVKPGFDRQNKRATSSRCNEIQKVMNTSGLLVLLFSHHASFIILYNFCICRFIVQNYY